MVVCTMLEHVAMLLLLLLPLPQQPARAACGKLLFFSPSPQPGGQLRCLATSRDFVKRQAENNAPSKGAHEEQSPKPRKAEPTERRTLCP